MKVSLRLKYLKDFILIGTKDVVDYGFTLAGLEKRDHSKQLVGDLDDVYIQTLLIDYRRNGPSKQNPRPVVSQDRRPRNGGLDPDHPYTKGLFATLQPILSPNPPKEGVGLAS